MNFWFCVCEINSFIPDPKWSIDEIFVAFDTLQNFGFKKKKSFPTRNLNCTSILREIASLLKIYALVLMNSFSNWELAFLVNNNSELKRITQQEFTTLPTVKEQITSIACRRVLKMKQDGPLSLCGERFCLLHVIFVLMSYHRANSGSEDKSHPLFPPAAAELCCKPTPAQGSDPGSPPASSSQCLQQSWTWHSQAAAEKLFKLYAYH